MISQYLLIINLVVLHVLKGLNGGKKMVFVLNTNSSVNLTMNMILKLKTVYVLRIFLIIPDLNVSPVNYRNIGMNKKVHVYFVNRTLSMMRKLENVFSVKEKLQFWLKISSVVLHVLKELSGERKMEFASNMNSYVNLITFIMLIRVFVNVLLRLHLMMVRNVWHAIFRNIGITI